MMSEWEKIVDHEIKFYYESIDNPYHVFQNKPWQHLFDEERQMVAEMYWEDMLSSQQQHTH